jgi:hypothetical protein
MDPSFEDTSLSITTMPSEILCHSKSISLKIQIFVSALATKDYVIDRNKKRQILLTATQKKLNIIFPDWDYYSNFE